MNKFWIIFLSIVPLSMGWIATGSWKPLPLKLLNSATGLKTMKMTTNGACERKMSFERKAFLTSLLFGTVAIAKESYGDSTGKFSSKRTAKNRYVPRILKVIEAMDKLESGALSADAFLPIAEDAILAMRLYGQAQKRGEYPDKVSERCVRNADAFDRAVKALSSSDLAASAAQARTRLVEYLADLPRDGREPFGSGMAPPPPQP